MSRKSGPVSRREFLRDATIAATGAAIGGGAVVEALA